jgi:biopolymer transport protein ExbD
MAMSAPASHGDDDEEVMAAINTTPLVDIMLVMLIIFLITVPVVTQAVQLQLPKASNIPIWIKPENIVLSVREDGSVWYGMEEMTDRQMLRDKLQQKVIAAVNDGKPVPEVHIRGDKKAKFAAIGRVIIDVQRSAIQKIAFTTEPDAPTGR